MFRSEDTDQERSKKEYENNIVEGLKWLGIEWDGDIVRQSERIDVYRKYADKLINAGKAKYEKGIGIILKQLFAPRLVVGGAVSTTFTMLLASSEEIVFNDLVRGQIRFPLDSQIDKIVLIKSDGTPTYNFAVTVDDYEMKVTHVIRGEDHISNTPVQIAILEALGFERPQYAHIPLILAPDRSKLSKRHGATAVSEYRNMGYLPEAMVNYLALLGWNPGTEQEIFTIEELIEQFDLKKIQKGGAVFDQKKLDWINKEHIKRLPEAEQKKLLLKSIENEPYMQGEPELDLEKLPWKKSSREETLKHLEEARKIIESGGNLMEYAEREGKGNVLWPVRYALTGAEASPDPFTILEFLGIEKSLKRLEKAIMALRK